MILMSDLFKAHIPPYILMNVYTCPKRLVTFLIDFQYREYSII